MTRFLLLAWLAARPAGAEEPKISVQSTLLSQDLNGDSKPDYAVVETRIFPGPNCMDEGCTQVRTAVYLGKAPDGQPAWGSKWEYLADPDELKKTIRVKKDLSFLLLDGSFGDYEWDRLVIVDSDSAREEFDKGSDYGQGLFRLDEKSLAVTSSLDNLTFRGQDLSRRPAALKCKDSEIVAVSFAFDAGQRKYDAGKPFCSPLPKAPEEGEKTP